MPPLFLLEILQVANDLGSPSWCSRGQVKSRREKRESQSEDEPGHPCLRAQQHLLTAGPRGSMLLKCPTAQAKGGPPGPPGGPSLSVPRPGTVLAGPHLSALVPAVPHPPQASWDRGLLLRQGPESRSLTHEVRAQDELLQQREVLLELVGAHVHGHAARPRAPGAAMRSHAQPRASAAPLALKGARSKTRRLRAPPVPPGASRPGLSCWPRTTCPKGVCFYTLPARAKGCLDSAFKSKAQFSLLRGNFFAVPLGRACRLRRPRMLRGE